MIKKRLSLLPKMGDRSQSLDILRFFAVVLVLWRHSWVCPAHFSPVVHSVTLVLARGGWIGVDLFFVLSGFLISGLLFKESQTQGQISLSRFYLRRGFKIYPAFWVLILFTIGLELVVSKTTSAKWIVSELLFFQNYGAASQWVYTWSLAVEEHFYIFLPLLLVVLLKSSSNRAQPFGKVPCLFGLIAAGCLVLRLNAAASGAFSCQAHLMPTHLRFDSLFFGVLISYYYHYHRPSFDQIAQKFGRLCIASGSLLLLPAFIFDQASTPYLYTFGYTEFYLGSGLILIGFLGRGTSINPLNQCLAFIGTRSYSIYLWHGPVFWFANERFAAGRSFFNWYGWTVTSLGGAILMGIAMAAVIEYPVLLVRDRWFPSRSQNAIDNPSKGASREIPCPESLGIMSGSELGSAQA